MQKTDKWTVGMLFLLVAALTAICMASIVGQMEKASQTRTEYVGNRN